MSENRQAAKDRLAAGQDYLVNLRAEMEIAAIHARFDDLADRQWAALLDVQRQQLTLPAEIERLARAVPTSRFCPACLPTGDPPRRDTDFHAFRRVPSRPLPPKAVSTSLSPTGRSVVQPASAGFVR